MVWDLTSRPVIHLNIRCGCIGDQWLCLSETAPQLKAERHCCQILVCRELRVTVAFDSFYGQFMTFRTLASGKTQVVSLSLLLETPRYHLLYEEGHLSHTQIHPPSKKELKMYTLK